MVVQRSRLLWTRLLPHVTWVRLLMETEPEGRPQIVPSGQWNFGVQKPGELAGSLHHDAEAYSSARPRSMKEHASPCTQSLNTGNDKRKEAGRQIHPCCSLQGNLSQLKHKSYCTLQSPLGTCWGPQTKKRKCTKGYEADFCGRPTLLLPTPPASQP